MAEMLHGFMENSLKSIGAAAMFLALTQTIYDEDQAKQMVVKNGFRAVVTEVGGKTSSMTLTKKLTEQLLAQLLMGKLFRNLLVIYMLLFMQQQKQNKVFYLL